MTPFRTALVSLVVFGVFAFAAYRKYKQTKRAKQYAAMREEQVRSMRGLEPSKTSYATFSQAQDTFINEKSRLLP